MNYDENGMEYGDPQLSDRFRGFLPVVIDLETGGFNAATDAILEVAISILKLNEDGLFAPDRSHHFNVTPFAGANIEQSALDFTGIDPYHPFARRWMKPRCSHNYLAMLEKP